MTIIGIYVLGGLTVIGFLVCMYFNFRALRKKENHSE